MFKKSPPKTAPTIWGYYGLVFDDKKKKLLNKPNAWYNVFYKEIIQRVDEEPFKKLYTSTGKGRPNVPVRRLIGMIILKEANGWSDKVLLEQANFNITVMKALGYENINDTPPSISSYYSFKRALAEHYEKTGEDLLTECFQHITTEQIKAFDIQGNIVRMDSKLIHSNIVKAKRLHLIASTVKKFIQTVPDEPMKRKLKPGWFELLQQLKEKSVDNFIYPLNAQEQSKMLNKFGMIIRRLLRWYKKVPSPHYDLLRRVYEEQYIEIQADNNENSENGENPSGDTEPQTEKNEEKHPSASKKTKEISSKDIPSPSQSNSQETFPENPSINNDVNNSFTASNNKSNHAGVSQESDEEEEDNIQVIPKAPKDIPSHSMQSPHDPQAGFRQKGHGRYKQHIQGYHSNLTEIIDKEKDLKFITDVLSKEAYHSENEFLIPAVIRTQKILEEALGKEKVSLEKVLADGAYDSKENRKKFNQKDMPQLRLSHNKGTPLAYYIKRIDSQNIEVYLRESGEQLPVYYSEKIQKYVIELGGKRKRYMTESQVDEYIMKQEMTGLTEEERGLRANMEATIHQVFHRLGKHNKVRYRGLIKTHWYVLARAFWVNIKRLISYLEKIWKKYLAGEISLEKLADYLVYWVKKYASFFLFLLFYKAYYSKTSWRFA